jgi:hypothetical protein
MRMPWWYLCLYLAANVTRLTRSHSVRPGCLALTRRRHAGEAAGSTSSAKAQRWCRHCTLRHIEAMCAPRRRCRSARKDALGLLGRRRQARVQPLRETGRGGRLGSPLQPGRDNDTKFAPAHAGYSTGPPHAPPQSTAAPRPPRARHPAPSYDRVISAPSTPRPPPPTVIPRL